MINWWVFVVRKENINANHTSTQLYFVFHGYLELEGRGIYIEKHPKILKGIGFLLKQTLRGWATNQGP